MFFGLIKRGQNTPEKILKYPDGKRYYTDFHNVTKNKIDGDTLKVISRLHQFGYKAYVVGGCIRDILMNLQPKDFDVVTNARPHEIKRIFTNSRVIGRRFKIVHVFFHGNKNIEVSTARSLPSNRFLIRKTSDLYLKTDNQYGTFKEDAARRDFTVNALFFDVRNETIIDYTGGFDNIKDKLIKAIGDPDVSLPEDPVRMLRAVKFASLLTFELDPVLLKSIRKNKKYIRKASIFRLHEEYNKIFRTSQSSKIFSLLAETGLFEAMFPKISKVIQTLNSNWSTNFGTILIGQRLAIADKMILEHEDVNTTVYYAIFLADYIEYLSTRDKIDFTNIKPNDKSIEKKMKEYILSADKELGLTNKEVEHLVKIFIVQNNFSKEVNDKMQWVNDFKQQKFFLEAFIFYKINARSKQDNDAIQKALFWEIGLRKKLPDGIKKIKTYFARPNNKK